MRLDITEILHEVGKSVPYDLQEPPLVDEDVECSMPIQGRITFTNTGGTLLVRGKANTSQILPCSRCSEYFEQIADLQIEEAFELQQVSTGPRSLPKIAVIEEDENPVAAQLFEGTVFDLTEMLRQYLLLEQPTQPLPLEDTEGRCSQCRQFPDEVLKRLHIIPDSTNAEAEVPINPAFAKLNELLQSKE